MLMDKAEVRRLVVQQLQIEPHEFSDFDGIPAPDLLRCLSEMEEEGAVVHVEHILGPKWPGFYMLKAREVTDGIA